MKKQIKYFIALSLVLLSLSSCSYVFYGGITGEVKDAESDTGIDGVIVYVYFSESDRNADYEAAINGSAPSRNSRQTSTSNGTFSVDKIIWETSSSSYGKSADEVEVFLLMYKSEYGEGGWFKNTSSIIIASDSANSSVYSESFTKTKDSKDVTLVITDVAGATVVGNFEVSLAVTGTYASDCTVIKNGDLSYTITYPKEDSSGNALSASDIMLSITYTSDDNPAIWAACYNNDSTNSYSFIQNSTVTEPLTSTIPLYVKARVFNWPSVTGAYNDGSSLKNGVNVYLCLSSSTPPSTADAIASAVTNSTYSVDGNEISKGTFTLTPDSNFYWLNETYMTRYAPYPTSPILYVLTVDGSTTTTSSVSLTGITTATDVMSVGEIVLSTP